MKKIFLLCAMIFFISGCTSIQNSKIADIIDDTINSKVKTLNVSRKGYRYYLPKGLVLKSSDNYNEVFTNNKYNFYLYVDIVSYYNKIKFSYQENNQYLIEIMYNYAKIEVIGYEQDIEEIVAYLMSIITSITYNDSVINSYLNSNEDFKEENFDIFEIVGSDNYLEFTTDNEDSEGIKDPDYVN